jgi:PPOX class probable F420-dependent enzyme
VVQPDTLASLPAWARSLLAEARHGHLALLDDGGAPRVLPVTFALLEGEVISAVDHKPKRRAGAELARVRWLRRDPRAAFGVDRYDDDWTRLAWVQLLGRVSVEDTVGDAALEALQTRYPQYRDHPPGGPLLRLQVERALCWSSA